MKHFTVSLHRQMIDTTQPGDEFEVFQPGPKRAYLNVAIRIPTWLAMLLYRRIHVAA